MAEIGFKNKATCGNLSEEERIKVGYFAMAAEAEREAAATEWCEALVGDSWNEVQ